MRAALNHPDPLEAFCNPRSILGAAVLPLFEALGMPEEVASKVGQIPNQRLKDAEQNFRAIVEGPAAFRSRDIDWDVVRKQLLRLQSAVQQNDVSVFDEAYAMLKSRLAPANVLRGEIGPEPENKSTVMPPQVFELLNHIVDTLHLETSQQPSPGEQKGGSEK